MSSSSSAASSCGTAALAGLGGAVYEALGADGGQLLFGGAALAQHAAAFQVQLRFAEHDQRFAGGHHLAMIDQQLVDHAVVGGKHFAPRLRLELAAGFDVEIGRHQHEARHDHRHQRGGQDRLGKMPGLGQRSHFGQQAPEARQRQSRMNERIVQGDRRVPGDCRCAGSQAMRLGRGLKMIGHQNADDSCGTRAVRLGLDERDDGHDSRVVLFEIGVQRLQDLVGQIGDAVVIPERLGGGRRSGGQALERGDGLGATFQ